jgi:putative phosphoesterase
MPVDLAVVSDTHIPGRETEMPPWVRRQVEAADHTIHAGDFDAPETLAFVEDLAQGLTAVAGNIDPPSVDLPDVATVTLEGVTFVVVHGTGPHESWPERVAGLVREAVDVGPESGTVVGVAGHTHTPTDTVVDGLRLLNPGSATGARPANRTTMLTVRIDGDALDVERHEE